MRWLLLLLVVPSVVAACVDPIDGMTVKESVEFCSGTYDMPNGLTIGADGITVDCNGAILRGEGISGVGIILENVSDVELHDCHVLTYDQGILLKNVRHSTIHNNGILKNRIGIRLIDAYENTIQDNTDKSHHMPISGVNSKFNIVMLQNRNIDHEFCEENACDKYRDMQVCVDGDFYCSRKCSHETDKDCRAPKKEVKEEPKEAPEEQIKKLIEEAEQEFAEKQAPAFVPEETKEVRRSLPVSTKVIIYILAYGCAFVALRRKKR